MTIQRLCRTWPGTLLWWAVCFGFGWASSQFVYSVLFPTEYFMSTHDGLQPDAFWKRISNTCDENNTQTFVYYTRDGNVQTDVFENSAICKRWREEGVL